MKYDFPFPKYHRSNGIEIGIASVISWKRKIILHEIEIVWID
jgi:hypothetical protein